MRRSKPEVRDLLAIRDGWKCHWCGRELHRDDAGPYRPTIEHKYPKHLGGKNSLGNLRLACHDCNNRRGPSVGPPKLAPMVPSKPPPVLLTTRRPRSPIRDACVACGRPSPGTLKCRVCS